jgi:hypothetical protein
MLPVHILSNYAFGPIQQAFSRAASNPLLALHVYRRVLDTFRNVTVEGKERTLHIPYSLACDAMSISHDQQILSTIFNYDSPIVHCNILSQSPVELINQAGSTFTRNAINYNDKHSLFDGVASLVLAYIFIRSFDIYRARGVFISPNLDPNERMDRVLIYILTLGLILAGIDALTDCFGLMASLSEYPGVVVATCARACNDGLFKNGIVAEYDDHDELFKLPPQQEKIIDTDIGFNKTVAAAATIIAAPTAMLIAKFSGRYFHKPRHSAPEENSEPRAAHHHGL